MSKEAVSTEKAPAAIGPYSQAVSAGGWVFVSGQIPLDGNGGMADGVGEQTEQAIKNMEAILAASGLSLSDVVKTTAYLVDLKEFPAFNEAYARRFQPPYPARATVEVSALPKGALVEIEAVAVSGGAKT